MADDEDRTLVPRGQRLGRRLDLLAKPLGKHVDRRQELAPGRLDTAWIVPRANPEQRVDPAIVLVQAHRPDITEVPRISGVMSTARPRLSLAAGLLVLLGLGA